MSCQHVSISQLFHLTVVLRNKETTFIRSRSVNDIANKRKMDLSFGCFARSGQIDRFRSIYLFWNSISDNNNDSFYDNSKIHLKCFLCFYCHLLTEWRSFLKYSLKEKNYDHLRVRDDLRYFLSPEREVQPNDSFRVRIILNVTFIPCHEQFRIHYFPHKAKLNISMSYFPTPCTLEASKAGIFGILVWIVWTGKQRRAIRVLKSPVFEPNKK